VEDGETLIFSSLDGEDWLPVNRPGKKGDVESLARLFEGDGNMKPMRFRRSYLEAHGANFETAEP
jgi:hypothetical protein